MPCFHPMQGYESRELTSNGKRKTVMDPRNARYCLTPDGYVPKERVCKCNKCFGCRNQYSREWSIRCMHEAFLWEKKGGNSFITLTYNDDFLPRVYSDDGRILGVGTLNYDHWTKFVKRFRKALVKPLFDSYKRKYGKRFKNKFYWRLAWRKGPKIRFYMGPEYGTLNHRPHYHAIIFNYDFPDKVHVCTRQGHKLYQSRFLDSLWTCPKTGKSMGYCSVGSVTFQSAAYVARYMDKKVKGDDVEGRYQRFNLETGEVYYLAPEKARISNRDGIGKGWFDLYHSDVYRPDVDKDFITVNGVRCRPPRYYDSLLERISPQDFEAIRLSRQLSMKEFADNFSPDRLYASELIFLNRTSRLVRSL